ncbi:Oligosaccaryltransferase-domain-containing protein [Xylariaceae sp. FL0255]|nr:Oligosaccaryltransferase-domain-containing protein [Xylariaceae sp. FL0255]
MISDNDLHVLAVFLGSAAMVLIVVYHFFEVNSKDTADEKTVAAQQVSTASKSTK